MGLVAAKCTQCGANIEVDASKEAGVCSHCGRRGCADRKRGIWRASFKEPGDGERCDGAFGGDREGERAGDRGGRRADSGFP